MSKDEIVSRLSALPKGGITIKKIKSKSGKVYEYYFLQWSDGKKRYSRRLDESEVSIVKEQLMERDRLEDELRIMPIDSLPFFTDVLTDETLLRRVRQVGSFKKRECYALLERYIYGTEYNRVFILYGLRRTGKTTLMKQLINDMSDEDFKKTAFIQIRPSDDLAKLNKDLRRLEQNDYRYIFIDEVTLMEDFIEGAALLSDIYAASGMKIVLSGTDSLGFFLAKSNELYDRCRFAHTTFIPYREFENVLGIRGIDKYIQYGGTMSMSGEHYNDNAFLSKPSVDEYIDSAIAHNIQHSLKCYEYEGHFRHLYSLYEQNELTNAINRVVEDINHRFTVEILTKDFKSNDLSISSKNFRKDKENPSSVLDDIDAKGFTERLMSLLEIKNKSSLSINLDKEHVREIQEYLVALDLIKEIRIEHDGFDGGDGKKIVFTQPGLRYSQAKSFIDALSSETLISSLPYEERNRVFDRVTNEIKGRMLEDIVLLETQIANPDKEVFKLQFYDGEFDMVVWDSVNGIADLYEIKYSKVLNESQVRHLTNKDKCERARFMFGKIGRKAVVFRGISCEAFGVSYLNVEEYLNSLGSQRL